MPKTLWKSSYKNRKHWRILWSNDWKSLTPWLNDSGLPERYFAKDFYYSESRETKLTTWYIGPIAIILGELL